MYGTTHAPGSMYTTTTRIVLTIGVLACVVVKRESVACADYQIINHFVQHDLHSHITQALH